MQGEGRLKTFCPAYYSAACRVPECDQQLPDYIELQYGKICHTCPQAWQTRPQIAGGFKNPWFKPVVKQVTAPAWCTQHACYLTDANMSCHLNKFACGES